MQVYIQPRQMFKGTFTIHPVLSRSDHKSTQLQPSPHQFSHNNNARGNLWRFSRCGILHHALPPLPSWIHMDRLALTPHTCKHREGRSIVAFYPRRQAEVVQGRCEQPCGCCHPLRAGQGGRRHLYHGSVISPKRAPCLCWSQNTELQDPWMRSPHSPDSNSVELKIRVPGLCESCFPSCKLCLNRLPGSSCYLPWESMEHMTACLLFIEYVVGSPA